MMDKAGFIKCVKALRGVSEEYARREGEFGIQEVAMIKFEDASGNFIMTPHYGVVENEVAIHATSNTKFKLGANQKIDEAMASLVKKGAKNPGTVLTWDVKSFKMYDRAI